MNMLRSWARGGAGLLLAALLLAGCGGESAPAPAPPTATAPPATFTPNPATAAPAAAAPPAGDLATAADLKAMLGAPTLRVVDMGSADEYAAGHIPGAIHIDWSELQISDTHAPAIAAWQGQVAGLLGARGIAATDRVVIYDHGTLYGARLWWVLDQLGHADKAILDGGFAAWQAAGGAVSKEVLPPAAVAYVAHPQPAVLATEAQVLGILGQRNVQIVDARSPGEYQGASTDGTARGGHIPGAVNVPFTSTAADGVPHPFKSPADLRALFAAQGVTPDQGVITYCSTGVRASVDYFALRRAGFANVRVYTGSWAEWGNDLTAPLAR